MKFNFKVLIKKFNEYLQKKNIPISNAEQNNDYGSIFNHAKEFQNFLNSEYNNDFSLTSISITDLSKIDLTSDGQIIINPEEEDDNPDDYNFSGINVFNNIYNELTQNTDFFNSIDYNHNGEISDSEKEDFLYSIQNYDNNKSNLSIADLLNAANAIKEKQFSDSENKTITMPEAKESKKETETDRTKDKDNINSPESESKNKTQDNDTIPAVNENTESIKDLNKKNNTSNIPNLLNNNTVSKKSGKINGNNWTKKTDNTNKKITEPSSKNTSAGKKNLSNMSKAELQAELKNAQGDYNTSKSELNSILNGSNPKLQEMEKDAEATYTAYKSELDKNSPQQGEQLQKYVNDIAAQEKVVDGVQKNFYDLDSSEKDAKIQVDISTKDVTSAKQMYDSVQNSLKSIDKKKNPDIYESLKGQVSKTKQDWEKAQNELKNAKTKLTETTKQKQDAEKKLKQEKEKLLSLNSSKNAFETQLTLNKDTDSIATVMNDYNTTKANVAKTKEDLTAQAKSKVDKAQEKIGQIKEQLAKQDREAPLFLGKNSKISMQFINDGKTIPYLLIGPKNAQPNLPLLVYLHGSNPRDPLNVKNSAYGIGPANIMKNWNLENPNAYIAIPVLEKGKFQARWASDKGAEYVKDLVNTITQEHSINKSKISIAGHSLGGWGAQYIAGKLKGMFHKAAALSPSRAAKYTPQSLGIPFKVYVGEKDGANCIDVAKSYKNQMNKNDIIWYKDTEHGGVPKAVIGQDSNHNGRSDFLEWILS